MTRWCKVGLIQISTSLLSPLTSLSVTRIVERNHVQWAMSTAASGVDEKPSGIRCATGALACVSRFLCLNAYFSTAECGKKQRAMGSAAKAAV